MVKNVKVILSIDGGGIRGIVPLIILKHIQQVFAESDSSFNFADFFHVFSGTSTGAIISAALMLKDKKNNPLHSVDSIIDLYATRGKQVFSNQSASQDKKFPLKIVLENNFGAFTLSAVQQHFLFLSYDMNFEIPFIFTDNKKEYAALNLSKAMLACSSIPGYFPAVQLGQHELVDGAFYSKNTTELAYNYAKSIFPNDHLLVLSIGTGELRQENNDKIEQDMLRQHHKLLEISQKNEDFSYFRFQPKLHLSNDNMDDVSDNNIQNLIADTQNFIQNNPKQFNNFFDFFQEKSLAIKK